MSRGGVSFSVGRDHRDRDRCDQPPCSMQRPTPLHRRPSFSLPSSFLLPSLAPFLLSPPQRERERESRGTARHHHDSYHDSLFHRPRIAKSFQMLIAPFLRQRSTLQSDSNSSRAIFHPTNHRSSSLPFLRFPLEEMPRVLEQIRDNWKGARSLDEDG